MAERTTVKKSIELQGLLSVMPMTYEDLCTVSGLSAQRIAYWRKSNADDIYIADWAPDKNGRLFVPVFAWGKQPDKARPGRVLSSAERMRALRAKKKTAAA